MNAATRLLCCCLLPACLAATANASAATPFLRVAEDDNGRPRALETAIVSYETVTSAGPVRVDLVSAVHIGDRAYYATLNDLFDAYDVLLYELITPSAEPARHGAGSGSVISTSQTAMRHALGLAFQLDEIDYRKPNFVHADLTTAELKNSMADRGESLYVYFWRVFYASIDEYTRDPLGLRGGNALAEMLADDQANGLRTAMAIELADADRVMTALDGENGSALIQARNEHAIRVLQAQLEAGAGRIGIFYGAAHMADFERRLLDEMKLVRTGTRWIRAWQLGRDAEPGD
jgi:hypothetical protein